MTCVSLSGGESQHQALLDCVGELGELCVSRRVIEAREHMFRTVIGILGSGGVWWNVSAGPGEGPEVVQSDVFGLDDWQVREWEKPFLVEEGYRQHPMWAPFFARSGLRTVTRDDLVSDGDWYQNPHREIADTLGFDHTIATAVPIGGGRECTVAVSRPRGDSRFSARERALLHRFQGATAWFHRGLASGSLVREALTARLAPRNRAVLHLLLRGHSEKEVACMLGLRPRTVHKYVEGVYRAFDVCSRAQLMALWIDPLT